MHKPKTQKIEDAIVELLLDILTYNHSEHYTYEGFINDTIEIYAFSKIKKNEKYCIIRIGVQNAYQQIHIPNILTPPLLEHQRVGKKLIRILFELGQLYGYDVFVVQLTDSFKLRLLKRGALRTNQYDILQIVETTNLLEPQKNMDYNYQMECVDRYGNINKFKYSIEQTIEYNDDNDLEKFTFRVMPVDFNTDDWFEFSVVKIDDNAGKISSMTNHGVSELRGMGIPEKLIELAASQFGLRIISSSNKPLHQKLEKEWRTIDANKVWDRLVKQNKASYDTDFDIYTYCP